MRTLTAPLVALGCCAAAFLAGLAPAMAQQSYLYPPEVRARPIVVVLDPSFQRRYWDPRYCDVQGAAAARRWRRVAACEWR